MQALIAFPKRDEDLAEEIDDRLYRSSREMGLTVKRSHIVSHFHRAVAVLQEGAFSHCIVHDDLPTNLSAQPASGGAFELAMHIKSQRPEVRVLLVHARSCWTDVESERIADLNVRAVRNNAEGITNLIQRILDGEELADTVEITIDLSREPSKYEISSNDVPVRERQGELRLPAFRYLTYRVLSKQFEEAENWNEAMTALSSDLWGSLVQENPDFRAALRQVLKGDAISERSRLHFRVDPQQYEVAFETIRYPDDASFWMLRTPVFRSLGGGNTQPAAPIFEGTQSRPLNCLVILSAAAGHCTFFDASGAPVEFRSYERLRRAEDECDRLHALLEAARHRVDQVVTIGRERPLTTGDLKKTLSLRQWDIVHYIGHTDFRDPRGFLILPSANASDAEAVGVEEIAPHLLRTRFVYLSSCEGTKLAFVRRLAEHGVPSILGFRSKVRDDLALEHALYFYDRLFALRSIERAFLATRQEFHRTYPKERLWACSSLIMQRG
jgi:CHAT domain